MSRMVLLPSAVLTRPGRPARRRTEFSGLSRRVFSGLAQLIFMDCGVGHRPVLPVTSPCPATEFAGRYAGCRSERAREIGLCREARGQRDFRDGHVALGEQNFGSI